jgi:hypothetical protein
MFCKSVNSGADVFMYVHEFWGSSIHVYASKPICARMITHSHRLVCIDTQKLRAYFFVRNVYVYVCVCMHVCKYAQSSTHTHTHTFGIDASSNMHIRRLVCMDTHDLAYTCTHILACMHSLPVLSERLVLHGH